MKEIGVLLKKELKEQIFASKGLIFAFFESAILTVYSLILISNRELSLLDNAEAVYRMSTLIIAVISLIAIVYGSDSFGGEYEKKTMDTLMIAPVTPFKIALSKLFSYTLIYLMLFLISMPYIWAVGGQGQNLIPAFVYNFVFGLLLMLIFAIISMIVSIKLKSLKTALSVSIPVLILLFYPLIVPIALRSHGFPVILDLFNPFAGAVNSLDSVIIDSQGLGFQIGRLAVMIVYVGLFAGILKAVSRRKS